jgi:hypothetical protein
LNGKMKQGNGGGSEAAHGLDDRNPLMSHCVALAGCSPTRTTIGRDGKSSGYFLIL